MPAPKVRSKDSVQQRLRDHKRQWNSTYKDFSQKLKALKDGMNGRGNAKLGLPPSNIKEPMPAEIGSYLSQLAGEFTTIVGDAESIIAEQAQYAKTRRRRRPKAPQQAPNPAPGAAPAPEAAPPAAAPNVVETLSRLGNQESDLEKEASNRLTRSWEYLTDLFSGREFNKQRVGLLSQAADLYYNLLDLENSVLSIGVGSIPKTVSIYKKFRYTFDSFTGTYSGTKALVEAKAEQEPKKDEDKKEVPAAPQTATQPEAAAPAPAVGLSPQLEQIKTDIHLLFNANLAKQQVIELSNMFKSYEEEGDNDTKVLWEDKIKEYYDQLVRSLSNAAQKKYGPANIKSMQDIINLVKQNTPKKASIADEMIKNSHNAITRGLKRKLVKLRSSNKTAPVRLQIDEILDNMKSTIKKIMDNLEKHLSIEELDVLIDSLEEDAIKLKRPIHVLNIFYMKDFFARKEHTKKKKEKGQPESTRETESEEMMDYILKKKLKRDLSEGYS